MQRILIASTAVLAVAFVTLLASIVSAGPDTVPEPEPDQTSYLSKRGDEELAYLLVKLELKTRAEDYRIGEGRARACVATVVLLTSATSWWLIVSSTLCVWC